MALFGELYTHGDIAFVYLYAITAAFSVLNAGTATRGSRSLSDLPCLRY